MKRTIPAFLILVVGVTAARADDIEREPIEYATAKADNAITRLQSRIAADEKTLTAEDPKSFLRSLLKELNVPESSQTLVFSRTSLQRQKISPECPRAIYFNDDVYVGACQDSGLFEISAVDPNLGVVFYSTSFEPKTAPTFTRHNDACMNCHGSSATGGYPGHLVRSVFPDRDGYPQLPLGSFRVDQRTPIKNRWGGWYVTGKAGKQTHLGNRLFEGNHDRDVVDPRSLNLEKLDDRIAVADYLNGHSDIAALMVLEHQAEMQNLLTRACFQTRIGLWFDRQLNSEAKKPEAEMSATTWRRIQNVGDQVVKYMLFADEAPIGDPIVGSSSFARDFAKQGPFDSRGRSLREIDLKSRLFKYPCSYLIYSKQFAGLPADVKDYVWRRLYDILSGHDPRPGFGHLTAEDRTAILEILRGTHKELPEYWR